MYEAIPYELKQLPNWCCFKIEKRNGRETKIPYNPITARMAQSNNNSTWVSFDDAVSHSHLYDGIGFFFSEPYIGIDIDDVADEIKRYLNDDHKENIVSEFVELLGSYSEISPSGNGIHIILKGELPPTGRRKGNIEMYSRERYFTMTGNTIGGYSHIVDDSDYNKLGFLHTKYIATPVIESRPLVEVDTHNLSDEEVIAAALKGKFAMRFQSFLDGSWEQFYASQSEADMAFCNDLAFWTARNAAQMDRIFRRSSLMREKWDRKTGDSTYGQLTLQKALQDCTQVYTPPRSENDGYSITIMDQSVKRVERIFYSYDDTGNAERYKAMHGDNLRFSYIRKNWFVYNGKTWEIDQYGHVKQLADRTIEEMKHETPYVPDGTDPDDAREMLQKHIKRTRNSAGKENMIKEAQHLLSIDIEDFDNDLFLFNLQNGYLDLNTGSLNPHERDKYFTRISNVEYDGEHHAPMWNQFLNEIFNGDAELIEYVQRAVGYTLSGSTEEQMMFVLLGNGRNGKSVFLDVINEIMGTYATNIRPESIMVRNNQGNANPDIAKLAGARFVTTTEPNDGDRLDEGLIKQLTGGDRVSARFLYEDEFEFTPQFKLWMATNHKPLIRGTDDGIWRRIAIVPFDVQIPEHKVDKRLPQKLKRELKGIMHWAMEGYLKWSKFGLQEPRIVAEQRHEYRTEMDVIEAFLEDECHVDKSNSTRKTTSADLYRAYKMWAKDNEQYLMSSTKFGREMGKKFQKIKSGNVYYLGVELRDTHPQNNGIMINY